MEILLLLLIVVSMTVFFYSVYRLLFLKRKDEKNLLEERLKNILTPIDGAEEELDKPLIKRLYDIVIRRVGNFFLQFTPKSILTMFRVKIEKAGGLEGMTVEQFLAFWGVIALILILAAILCGQFLLHYPINKVFGIALLAFAVGMILPLMFLQQKMLQRKRQITKFLPETVDLLCVSVQAGLSFEGALAKIVEKMDGVLVNELARLLQEMRMGIPRRTALRNFADRCDLTDVSLLVSALIQSEQFGVSLAPTLEIQARNIREKRRLRIREEALKSPVKLLLPLILFIFPTLLLVLLGPAMFAAMKVFH